MTLATPLDVLIGSARATRDGEARRLAEDLGNARAAEERMQLLEHYRHDYEQRFRDRSSLGLDMDAWRNYRLFLTQLDNAIEAQRHELAERRRAAEARRSRFNVAGQKVRSYETLAERREAERRIELGRSEQKATDEHTARHYAERSS